MPDLLQHHASILLVIVPLLAAPIVALIPNGRYSWAFTLIVTTVCLYLSLQILSDVVTESVIHYELGGWKPPWGIVYEIDGLNALMAVMISLVAVVVSMYARTSVDFDIPKEKQPLFYSAFLLCFLGLLGMSMTGDIFNVFVFLEISSLSTYALISMGRDRKALTAAFQYLILGTIGATFFLIGIGLAYAATGTLNMADLADKLALSAHTRTIETALGFILAGMGLKAAMFPLHRWLPRAYSYSPMVVSAFLAGTATKVAVYVFGRSVYTVFSPDYALSTIYDELLIIFGGVAVIYGAWQAIRQTHVKPLLAWSSISQIGYFMIGYGLLSSTGFMATMIHMFNHGLMKTALFLAAGILLYQTGTLKIDNLAGLARQSRLVFIVIVISGLSLIGVPGTVGFISKWYLVLAAVELQAWGIVAVILIGSLMAIVYVWKIVETLYFQPVDTPQVQVKKIPLWPLATPALFLALSCIYFGINTTITVNTAKAAVNSIGIQSGKVSLPGNVHD